MSVEQLEEMGPVDYMVLEWKGEQPTAGAVQPLLLELVDRGIIRIIDIAFLAKGEDGSVAALEIGGLKQATVAFAEFEGASSGLLGYEDLQEAATALDPGTSAAVLVWENRWAAPVAAALRRSGGQLVASDRIPIQAILAERWQRKESAPYGQPEPTYQEPAPQYTAPPAPQYTARPAPDPIQQLKDLADLKAQGILTEEEFAAQKARILSG
jgi:Family of unknown function (DUF6325)/Short C-terminal domain